MLKVALLSSIQILMSLVQWLMSMVILWKVQKIFAFGRLSLETSITQLSSWLISISCALKQNGLDKVALFYYFLMALMELAQSTQLAILRDSFKMSTLKFTIQ